jgi:hypothetical protein
MAKQGEATKQVPGEEMEAAGEVDLSAGAPEIFGDRIVAGDTPQPKPGAEDVGDIGAGGLQDGPEGLGEPVGFMQSKWPDDAVLPEEFKKYDTPAKLIEAHVNAVKKIGERSDEMQQLRTDNKALREGKVTEEIQALAERAQIEVGEGGLKRDTIDAYAQATHLPPPLIAALGQMMAERTNQFLDTAAKALGSAEKVQKFLDEMQQGRFTQGELDTYNGWATLGKVSWIAEVASQLGFEVDEAALKPAAAERLDESVSPAEPSPGLNRAVQQVVVGETPGPPPGPDIFTSRAEYLTAQSVADAHYNDSGDSSQQEAVRAKLHRSPTQQWGSQVGG